MTEAKTRHELDTELLHMERRGNELAAENERLEAEVARLRSRCSGCGRLYLDHPLYGDEPMREEADGSAVRCGEWIDDNEWHNIRAAALGKGE